MISVRFISVPITRLRMRRFRAMPLLGLGPVLLAAAAAHVAHAQQASASGLGATIQFRFANPQLQPARYLITLREDGSGSFHAEASEVKPDDPAALTNEGQDRPIQVTAKGTQRIFAVARARRLFNYPCEATGDHVAFTGKKDLSYSGPEGKGACEYNYSKDAQIQWLTTEMQGIAATLEEGRRLELEHEHGRLTLDAELETLDTMVHNGQALELGNIAPVLLAIVKDDAVLERAQKRARNLLRAIDQPAGQTPDMALPDMAHPETPAPGPSQPASPQ